MINKNKFSIKDTKKVLHKVGKRWVVVSAVLLGLVAGGAAVTTANADTTAQAAQPNAVQQVNENANKSAANHSFGAADPANATKASASNQSTMKLGADNGINVNTLMSSAIKDAKGKVPALKTSVKNRAKGYASAYSQYADVNHLTELANDVKGNSAASSAYTNLVKLANNASNYNSISLGTTSDSSNNTIFGMMSEASNDINTINNDDSVDAKGKSFLNKATNVINKVSNYANITNLGSGEQFTVPASKFSYNVSSVSLSTSISLSGVSISNISLPNSGFTYYNSNFSVDKPVINVQQLINKGIDPATLDNNVYNYINQVAGQASTAITNDAEKQANTFISNNASTIANSLANSSAVSNAANKAASEFVSDYASVNAKMSKLKALATLYKAHSQDLDMAISTYQSAYQNSDPTASLLLGEITKYVNTPDQKAALTSTLQHKSSTDVINELIHDRTGLSLPDASILQTNLNSTSQNPVNDAINDMVNNNLPNLLKNNKDIVPALESDAKDNPRNDPTRPNDSYKTINTYLAPTIESIIKNAPVNEVISKAVHNEINSIIPKAKSDIKYAVGIIAANNSNKIGPLSILSISKLQRNLNVLTYISEDIGLGSSLTKTLQGYKDKLTNLTNDLNGFFNTGKKDTTNTTSSAYNSLVSAVAALPSDLKTTSNVSSNSTEEYKAYSAYSTIASGAQDILNAAKRHVPAQYAHYVSDASNYATPSIVNEASTSASSMSSTMSSMTTAESIANSYNSSDSSLNSGEKAVENGLLSNTINSLNNGISSYANSLSNANTSVPLDEVTVNFAGASNGSVSLLGTTGESFALNYKNLEIPSDKYTIKSTPASYVFSGSASNSVNSANVTVNLSSASSKSNPQTQEYSASVVYYGSLTSSYPISSSKASATINAPEGYYFNSGSTSTESISLNGTTYRFDVDKDASETVNFSGASMNSEEFSGIPNTAESVTAPSGDKFTSGDGYTLSNSASTASFKLSNGSITINVSASSKSTPASSSTNSSSSAQSSGKSSTQSSSSSSAQSSSNSSASSSASSNSQNSANSTESNNSYNPSNASTNNMPFVPSFNGNSSVASASTEPSMASSNSSSASAKSEATAKYVEYAKVNKALQLHTNPNFSKKNAVAVLEPGAKLQILHTVKAHNGLTRYEVRYNHKNYYITANKKFVSTYKVAVNKHASKVMNYIHYRYAKVVKALQLHTSAKFTKRNGVKVVKPNTEFHINHIVKNGKYVRYEVRYQGHNYFITANHNYTVNAYVQNYNFHKHGYKAVRVIKPLNEYRKSSFAKRSLVRHFYRGSVLPVKRVITIAKGEMTRLQLTNGRYVTANKDFVKVIK